MRAAPAPSRSFPLFFQDGKVVYPQFAYPLRKEIVPIWAAALIAFFVPFFFFCLFQVRRRSLDDLLTTTMGLLKSLITAAVFQVCIIANGLLFCTQVEPVRFFLNGSSVVCGPIFMPSANQRSSPILPRPA
jgi:phosphoglycerol transferase MdoB-like AlkP superfamily enzyme